MNQIDLNPFTKTPVSIGGKVYGMLSTVFTKWFDQIVQALNRPTVTLNVAFPLTASGASSDFVVNFPKNTVDSLDCPVLKALPPPSGTCFTLHVPIGADQVWIRFNNYSGGALALPLPQAMTVTILKN